ncbi:MAG: TIGR03747 family integrating conjugative element membrane protein, partial [Gammaproteobacteria bacterium]
MASNTQRTTSAQQTTEQGIISLTLTRVMQLLIFLIMTLLFSISIEWLGMATDYWQESGIQHSEKMLSQELNYLNEDFKRSAIVDKPAQYAKNFADRFYHITFKVTGIQSAIIWLATPTPATQHKTAGFRRNCHDYYLVAENYILAAMVVTQVFAVRLAVLTLAIPASVLLAMLGLIDGLVQRDIRRWSGGRESSFVYHWAKKVLYPSLILPWIIYLAMPVSVHPNLIVLPFAVLFAVSVTVMASTFKKYI